MRGHAYLTLREGGKGGLGRYVVLMLSLDRTLLKRPARHDGYFGQVGSHAEPGYEVEMKDDRQVCVEAIWEAEGNWAVAGIEWKVYGGTVNLVRERYLCSFFERVHEADEETAWRRELTALGLAF